MKHPLPAGSTWGVRWIFPHFIILCDTCPPARLISLWRLEHGFVCCLIPEGRIKISSRGFKDAQFPADAAPFDHPLGLMFTTAAFFNAEGIHIDIESQSPPRSALGGSSAAAVALVAAFLKLKEQTESAGRLNRRGVALLAYQLEQSTAGVACGFQDQLAAAYGGVNAWYWQTDPDRSVFRRKIVVGKKFHKELEGHLLLAYCGKPHESKDINGRWVKQFLSGINRDLWADVIGCTHQFGNALAGKNYQLAAAHMNRETGIRRKMTPDVLDRARPAPGGYCAAKQLRCPFYGRRRGRVPVGLGRDRKY